MPSNLGPVTPPAPPSFPADGGRWHGIDLAKLAQAESRTDDFAIGLNGERGRYQMTRGALSDVNDARKRRKEPGIRFSSLTNSTVSATATREFIQILVRRIRAAGYEPTPNAIVCAWNDGVGDARRYGFDIRKAPRETRRLAQSQ